MLSLTPKQILKQRLNSGAYKILLKGGGVHPFQMNWAQEQLFDDLHNLNLILKARQLGFTTFICLLLLDACISWPNIRAGIIAHNLDDAGAIFRDKIKFAYDNLPDDTRAARPVNTDKAGELLFDNNSSIRVATSFRSGTLQYLHISEYGKICAKYPDKAKEIRTGALNAVEAGQMVFVESTAEGQSGHFPELVKRARDHVMTGHPLTPLDWKFHFFPWWKHPGYRLDSQRMVITSEDEKYFQELEDKHGIACDQGQRAWYVKKKEDQKEEMKREYPSTPEEAFESSIEGAYYSKQFAKVRAEKRIVRIPVEDGIPVNTAWDLGMDDYMAIGFYQNVGREVRWIDYYENNGEGLSHYVRVLADKGYLYGNHYFPPDINVRELSAEGKSRKEILEGMGVRVTVAPRLAVSDGIEAARKLLSICWFDESRCAGMVARLEAYRKSWNDKLGVFMEQPVHDESSHTADMFRYAAVTHEFDTPHGYMPTSNKTRSRVL